MIHEGSFFFGYPLVNDHIAGRIIPIFNRIHTSTHPEYILQPAMLVDPGVYMILSDLGK